MPFSAHNQFELAQGLGLDLVAQPKIAAEEYRFGFGGFRVHNTSSGNILKFPSQSYYDISFMY